MHSRPADISNTPVYQKRYNLLHALRNHTLKTFSRLSCVFLSHCRPSSLSPKHLADTPPCADYMPSIYKSSATLSFIISFYHKIHGKTLCPTIHIRFPLSLISTYIYYFHRVKNPDFWVLSLLPFYLTGNIIFVFY